MAYGSCVSWLMEEHFHLSEKEEEEEVETLVKPE